MKKFLDTFTICIIMSIFATCNPQNGTSDKVANTPNSMNGALGTLLIVNKDIIWRCGCLKPDGS